MVYGRLDIKITVQGMDRLDGLIKDKLAIKENLIRVKLLNGVRELTSLNIKNRTTGRLANSWMINKTGWFSYRLVNNVPYGRYWMYGRGIVRPIRASALHFFINGTEVFTQKSKGFTGHGQDFMIGLMQLVRSVYNG